MLSPSRSGSRHIALLVLALAAAVAPASAAPADAAIAPVVHSVAAPTSPLIERQFVVASASILYAQIMGAEMSAIDSVMAVSSTGMHDSSSQYSNAIAAVEIVNTSRRAIQHNASFHASIAVLDHMKRTSTATMLARSRIRRLQFA